jgi:hypothetical protein
MITVPSHAPTFKTERLQLAIYLHASERLALFGCELADSGKVKFVFRDPDRFGSQLELEFDRGAQVSAVSLFASQKFLRRQMSDTLNNRRIGKSNEHHP